MGKQTRRDALRRQTQSELERLENQFAPAVDAVPAAESDRVIWSFETEDKVHSSPTVVNDVVFVGSEDRRLYALNAATGTELWSHDPSRPVRAAPTVYGDLVISATYGNKVFALEAPTAEKRWEFVEYGGHFLIHESSSTTVADGIAYVGFGNGNVYALDAETGALEWRFPAGESVPTSPTVVNGIVYVASGEGTVYGIDAGDGDEVWSVEIGSEITSSPTVSEGTVFIGAHDREEENVYAFDAETGAREWASAVPPRDSDQSRGDVWTSPTVHDGVVYVGLDRGTNATFFALNAADGELEWQTSARGSVKSSPTVVDDTVYVGNNYGYITAFDAETGGERWVIQVDGRVVSSPTVVDGVLYVGSADGHVYAIETDTAGSSEGSRVSLGTLGHHGSFDGTGPSTGERSSESGSESESEGSNESDGTESSTESESEGGTDDAETDDGETDDDGLPGPGIVGSIGSLGGVSYLLKRGRDDDSSADDSNGEE